MFEKVENQAPQIELEKDISILLGSMLVSSV